MTFPSGPGVADPELASLRSSRWAVAGLAVVIALLFAAPAGALSVAPGAAPAVPLGAAHAAPAVAHPASSIFNPPCYKIDVGVCVSIASQNETDIIPPQGGFVSVNQPNCTTDIPLVIKSQTPLNYTASGPHSGPFSPILLNVTGNLWNGDPYYSVYDNDVWHSNSISNLWIGPTYVSTNKSGYYWWYNVTISAKASNGVPNFFAGMSIAWWVELTYNVSGVYIHHQGPVFHYTCCGAWPYSPYPGSGNYAGGSATFEDVNLTVTPRQPNWNDSVKLVLNTTQADVLTNATIGQAWVDVTETAPSGLPITSGTIQFPVTLTGGNFGAVTTTAVIPPSYAQVEGAVISYQLAIFDVASDQIVTPAASYVVGGNGSFLSGVFVDDLNLLSNPSSVIAGSAGVTTINPGTPIQLTLISRNTGTAISAAEIYYSVAVPLLHETIPQVASLHRVSSTTFSGTIPGLPLGTFLNFSVYAWDFQQRLEISPGFGYLTPDFPTYTPYVPGNSTFFYIFVYDNGSHVWVNGAHIEIGGPGLFHNFGNTTFGIAYPNETQSSYLPLLLPANSSYRVTVTDPWFQPASGGGGAPVNASIVGLHTMNNRQTLVQGSDYVVVQEGNAVIFYLNTTPPASINSPPVTGAEGSGSVPVAGLIGLVAVGIVAIPLALWWQQIRARRREEEKRVTL